MEPVNLAPPTVVDNATVDAIGASTRLLPTEDQFIGKPGYERAYRPDGTYEWRYSYEQNDGRGRLTKEGEEASRMLAPFLSAEEERASRRPRPDVVRMQDANGATQYLRPEHAEVAARNGYRHKPHYGRGRTVLVARGGKLYRCIDGVLREVA